MQHERRLVVRDVEPSAAGERAAGQLEGPVARQRRERVEADVAQIEVGRRRSACGSASRSAVPFTPSRPSPRMLVLELEAGRRARRAPLAADVGGVEVESSSRSGGRSFASA